ncbi:type II toxin-antitoxin system HicB family antitoxin [Rhizobium sp.]
MNAMHHKGYSARIDYDDEDEIFFGHLVGINDIIGFHAETVAELKAAFIEAVEDYLATCAQIGKEPNKPYSGKLMFRVKPELHANAARAASLEGKSLNQWAEEVLTEAVKRKTA